MNFKYAVFILSLVFFSFNSLAFGYETVKTTKITQDPMQYNKKSVLV